MIRVVSVSIDVDLRDLSRYLWQQGIQHRIIEESGEQVVFVREESQAETVRSTVDQFIDGQLEFKAVEGQWRPPPRSSLLARTLGVFAVAPVTMLLIAACLVVAVNTRLGAAVYRMEYLFYPELPSGSLFSLLLAIDSPLVFLQTLTPMFLHFGELHIIFNLLWLWYFGRQLETVQASWVFLLIVAITSFTGNTFQYLYSGAANFGGMSGVVYGLVGYAWVLHNFVPGKRLMMNQSLFIFFMIALVVMELLASNWIATAAHLGGVIAGLLAGLLVYLNSRSKLQASS